VTQSYRAFSCRW